MICLIMMQEFTISSTENIYNLYVFTDGEYVTKIGIKSHTFDEYFEDAKQILLSAINTDLESAIMYSPPKIGESERDFKHSYLMAMLENDQCIEIFNNILSIEYGEYRVSCCISVIQETNIELSGIPLANLRLLNKPIVKTEYVSARCSTNVYKYEPKLILSRDYFDTIKQLHKSKSYYACFKLILELIDLVAYIQFGKSDVAFFQWLDTYARWSWPGYSKETFLAFRNSIFVTNAFVVKNDQTITAKIFEFNREEKCIAGPGVEFYYERLNCLIEYMEYAVFDWLEGYSQPDDILMFIDRYEGRHYSVSQRGYK